MSGAYERMSAAPRLPTSTTTDTIPASAANTGGIDLSSFVGKFVSIRCDVACHLKAGETLATAGATDWPLPANERLDVLVTKKEQILSVYGLAAGTLYVAVSS